MVYWIFIEHYEQHNINSINFNQTEINNLEEIDKGYFDPALVKSEDENQQELFFIKYTNEIKQMKTSWLWIILEILIS